MITPEMTPLFGYLAGVIGPFKQCCCACVPVVMHGIVYFSFSFVPVVLCKVPVSLFFLPTFVILSGRPALQTLVLPLPWCPSNLLRVHFIH